MIKKNVFVFDSSWNIGFMSSIVNKLYKKRKYWGLSFNMRSNINLVNGNLYSRDSFKFIFNWRIVNFVVILVSR